MMKLKFKADRITKKDISQLHLALAGKLKLEIDSAELKSKMVGSSTLKAIKGIQKRYNLRVTGRLDSGTIEAINEALFDNFHTNSKTRTKRIHTMLERLGYPIAEEERARAITESSTRKALKLYQERLGLEADSRLSEELYERLVEDDIVLTYKTKRQISHLQIIIRKAAAIARLDDIEIDEAEVREKRLGATFGRMVEGFQKRYGLKVSGQINRETLEKLKSVASSRGSYDKKVKAPPAVKLKVVKKQLRLNMVSPQVVQLQKNLSFLGYKISESEHKESRFGKSTIRAIKGFQEERGLALTGHYDRETSNLLNELVTGTNPKAAPQQRYRIRGRVRNEYWRPKSRMVIKLFQKGLTRERDIPLAAMRNHSNGFFDIAYDPPKDPVNGKSRRNYHLLVKLYNARDQRTPVSVRTYYNVNPIHWVNFTESRDSEGRLEYNGCYKGRSDYEKSWSLLSRGLGSYRVEDLHELPGDRQISRLSLETGLSTDDIMCHLLAKRAAKSIATGSRLTTELFYAFLRQNLPPELGADLLRESEEWTKIDELVERTAAGIIFLSPELQEQALENALVNNIIGRQIERDRETLLSKLNEERINFTLKKPILVGETNLESLLELTPVEVSSYHLVAEALMKSRGVNSCFWQGIGVKEALLGVDVVKEMRRVFEIGAITHNHIPTVKFIKNNLGTAANVAKLSSSQIVDKIRDNGGQVPVDIDGRNSRERVKNFAQRIKAGTRQLYPATSLAAKIKRGNSSHFEKMDSVLRFYDDHGEAALKEQNLDRFISQNSISINQRERAELKLVHRLSSITSNSTAGAIMAEQGLHSSMQIYFKGKEGLTALLGSKGVSPGEIERIFEFSKMRYLQILARLVDFRGETNRDTPAAISSHSYSREELQEELGDIPNLETLFGSLDYCECEHCRSLYSPAAYLTDLLRFLGEKDSLEAGKSVKDILFERRPDLGHIKLNCINTERPLPYIDLVCEILENSLTGSSDFSYQTTLSAKELRATPQYVRPRAYERLASAPYPMNISFNLWQEESRSYLNHLRTPRYSLMESFRQRLAHPMAILEDASLTDAELALRAAEEGRIGGEYFSISAYERGLITTPAATAAMQKRFWKLEETDLEPGPAVSIFMKRTKLSYYELLELLQLRVINPPGEDSPCRIERPLESCATELQRVTNLTIDKLDLIHRFLRLWRRTGWKMWELDLLIRSPKVGGGRIDSKTLANLKGFKELQERLKLPFETMLALYGEINREVRLDPAKRDSLIQPLYNRLFQNRALTGELDSRFKAIANLNEQLEPLDREAPYTLLALNPEILFETNSISGHEGYSPLPTILSALAITRREFDLLIEIVIANEEPFSVAALSTLLRYSALARSLRLPVEELLLFLKTTTITDPFSSLKVTELALNCLERIREAGLTIRELDYILNHNEDSPIGLRDETLGRMIRALRAIMESFEEKKGELQRIEAFVPESLMEELTDAEVMNLLAPLQNSLTILKESALNDNFRAEEADYIVRFKESDISTESKERLVEITGALKASVESLMTNLKDERENRVESHIASTFSLTAEQAVILLEKLKVDEDSPSLLEQLTVDELLAAPADGEAADEERSHYKRIDRTNFPQYFRLYTLLHKLSLLVLKMKIETENLEWFIINREAVGSLNFAALPLETDGANRFREWYNLSLFLKFSKKFPEPEESSIRTLLDLAKDSGTAKAELLSELSALTQLDESELASLDAGLALKHGNEGLDYCRAEIYERLLKCFDQLKLVGVEPSAIFNWVEIIDIPATADGAEASYSYGPEKRIALETGRAAKAKYGEEEWLEKVTPLHNEIREKKRAALVEYLIESSMREQDPELENGVITNPLYWKDSTALYKHFLIDVEMSACQLTSRIKQALSSIQLFVQRCFLNLEKRYVIVSETDRSESSSPHAWSQWRWMKNYRIWEANRKVFFYPENWIEPELRDDKSPFFQELENELMQREITKDNVEEAFQNYLYKVDEVSNLDICGLYHQQEDPDPAGAGFRIDTIHVIGRTKAMPAIYYYRTFDMNYSRWSAWEKIDVDISSDHLLPVFYNRRLHLFWLQIMEKPMKSKKMPAAQQTDSPTDSPEPLKVMEIQLAWTVKKSKGWTTKQISKEKLIHPWERPHFAYNLRPYYSERLNELYLDIYLSTTKEFNDSKFYDPNKKYSPNGIIGIQGPHDSTIAWYDQTKINPNYLTANRFNEGYLPWHSSSFVFNGNVKDIKLKGLLGRYNNYGTSNSRSSSYDYVHNNFGSDGAAIKRLDPIQEYGPRLRLPTGMHYYNNHLTNNRIVSKNDFNLRVLEGERTVTLLSRGLNPFKLVISQQELQLDTKSYEHPLFYQDRARSFFIKPEWLTLLDGSRRERVFSCKYRFMPFYHPYTTLFIRELNRGGIDGLLNRKIQLEPHTFYPENSFNFNSYSPAPNVIAGSKEPSGQKERDIVDFSFSGAYSLYNWEIFYHCPLMIACRLMQNQKFEDAMHWFHYIFDPTAIEGESTPQRYWITKPFYNYNSDDYRRQRIQSILSNLHLSENSEQLKAWRNNPFKPHVIARYRPVVYQKSLVMKYIDNLISWGDMLFRRDTMESINEASLLYMLAYEILGERPQRVPNIEGEALTFNELEERLGIDDFGNARLDRIIEDTLLPIDVVPPALDGEPLPELTTLTEVDESGPFYFCIPNNSYISKYWDRVEDRLFKIRNCMNIQGVVRQLPLFEPPIDPALLVKAAAAGIDLSSVLNDLSAPTPYYRFQIVVRKAIEFCNEVKLLGDKLLSALEKKDVESLSLLRSQHEIGLLEAVKEVRKRQVDEAAEAISSLNMALAAAEERQDYYGSKTFVNVAEGISLALTSASLLVDVGVAAGYIVSGGLKLIPNFLGGGAGFGGTPVVKTTMGGQQIGNGAEMAVRVLQSISSTLQKGASLASTVGSYSHRKDDWEHQERLAKIEKKNIQFQIDGATIRKAIAEKELDNQELMIENAKAVDERMRNKFTNEQLYSWMITQISTVYFQAYQLAYEMAKSAENCYRHELGLAQSNIVQFGYWDSLKKGLLSGDRLMGDLHRLEAEYMERNKREFEITKHISLAQVAPLALINLKETGRCRLELAEWLFDMDYPGHYMRRIKNISLTIPCLVGPYSGVNCTLSLLNNRTRMESRLSGGSYEDESLFKTMYGSISSIATSSGQNDSGMFTLNFNDERYLPFEGAGVISEWQINMPKESNYFDFSSLSDLIVHISYTSRAGGGQLAEEARENLTSKLPDKTAILFSLKHDFSNNWHHFLNPTGDNDQEFSLELKDEHYPFYIRNRLDSLKIKRIDLFIESAVEGDHSFLANLTVTDRPILEDWSITTNELLDGVHHKFETYAEGSEASVKGEIKMNLKVAGAADLKSLTYEQVKDIFILIQL